MASNSETGHAKNIANLNLLNTHISQVQDIYYPSNPVLKLQYMQTIYATVYAQHQDTINLLAPYTFAVDEREMLFGSLNGELSKLRKAYKVTPGVTAGHLEDFMSVIRKIKGYRKEKKGAADQPEPESAHSISQMSYDQRTNHLGQLISLLRNTPNFNPNETEYKIETYEDKRTKMLETTQKVANTFVPLNNARSLRNHSLYYSTDNVCDIGNKAKEYLFTILDSNSTAYSAIARIKFKKVI